MTKEQKPVQASFSLVIPAHNGASVIAHSIKEYLKFLSAFNKYELIIVCNGCTDDTAAVAKKAAGKNNHVKIIEIAERGKGNAVIIGARTAQYEYAGFMDADNAFKLSSVAGMVKELKNYDCVIASKWLGRNFSQISEPFTRKVLAIGWRALAFVLFGLRFHDTQAGCKVFRRASFRRIDHEFICKGFDFDVELLYHFKKNGMSVKEMNIPVLKAFKFSTFRLKYVPFMFWNLFKMRIRTL